MPGSVLKKNARTLIFNNIPNVIITSLLYVTLTAIIAWLVIRLSGIIGLDEINTRLASGEIPSASIIFSDFKVISIFLAFAVFLFQPLLDVGFISFCLKLKRDKGADHKDLFNGFVFFIKILTIFLITSLYILMWSLLLIIPGIVASYRYRLAYYILLDDPRKDALQCISESRLIMNGKKLDLLTIDISFLGWFVLDALVIFLIPLPFAVPVVSLWLSPYLGLTRAGFYDDAVSKIAV